MRAAHAHAPHALLARGHVCVARRAADDVFVCSEAWGAIIEAARWDPTFVVVTVGDQLMRLDENVVTDAAGSALLKFHAPEIVFGVDSMAEAAHAALRLGALRPMLVTDPGLIAAGWVDEMVAHLREQGVRAVVWNDLTPNPKDHEIAAGYQRYAEQGCDVLVAVGGDLDRRGRQQPREPLLHVVPQRARDQRPHRLAHARILSVGRALPQVVAPTAHRLKNSSRP